jgi:hypothetical protein
MLQLKKDCEETAKDIAYFNAMSAARKLYEQLDYFNTKESPRREEMVLLAQMILQDHLLLLGKLTVEYARRHNVARDTLPGVEAAIKKLS